MNTTHYITLPENYYVITRTSESSKVSPCAGAFQAYIPIIDRRSVDNPSKILAPGYPDIWYRTGTNHRVENDCIVKDLEPKLVWVIEVINIPEFIKEYGEIIMGIDENIPYIEIYDSYRE